MSLGFWSGEMVAMRGAVKCKTQLSSVMTLDVSETLLVKVRTLQITEKPVAEISNWEWICVILSCWRNRIVWIWSCSFGFKSF